MVANIIPPRLADSVHFDSLERLNLLNCSVNKALLLLRFISEKQMPNVVNMFAGTAGDEDEEIALKLRFAKVLISIADAVTAYINLGQKMLLVLTNCSVEQYVKATTGFMAWKKVEAVDAEMTTIIGKLKDENLTAKFDTGFLEEQIKLVSELYFKVEKLFIEKTPEELAQEKPAAEGEGGEDVAQKYEMTAAQLERQKLVQTSYKLDLRHQALRMSYAIMAVRTLIADLVGAVDPNFAKKAQLIYGRLLDVVFKLDHIDVEDTGKQYLNLADLVVDKRLAEKFEVVRMLWSDDATDAAAIQDKNWGGVLDAIQKDITGLSNDYKFKRLIKDIDAIYEDQPRSAGGKGANNLDAIFFIDRFKNESSPWMEIVKRIQSDIQNSEALKDKIVQLTTKRKEQLDQNMRQEKQLDTMKVTVKSLEQRLAQKTTEVEQLNQVKTENE